MDKDVHIDDSLFIKQNLSVVVLLILMVIFIHGNLRVDEDNVTYVTRTEVTHIDSNLSVGDFALINGTLSVVGETEMTGGLTVTKIQS